MKLSGQKFGGSENLRYLCSMKTEISKNMETATLQSSPFSPFQIEMLELVSRVKSEVEMQDIRQLLGKYFAQRAEDAMDRLWDEGILNERVMEEWKKEHMRTPYRQ